MKMSVSEYIRLKRNRWKVYCEMLELKWAFEHPQVLAVEAESDPDNAASQRVLEKCGFLATGAIGEEGPRFIVYKENNKQ